MKVLKLSTGEVCKARIVACEEAAPIRPGMPAGVRQTCKLEVLDKGGPTQLGALYSQGNYIVTEMNDKERLILRDEGFTWAT
jgi:hypothetical protein